MVEELRKAAIVIDVQNSGRAVGVADPGARPGREDLMAAVSQLTPTVGVTAACAALGVVRASFYRQLVPNLLSARPSSARALTQQERATVRDLLNSPRFVNAAPAAIQATLLDEGRYLCSTRTLYRLLAKDGATRERRDQLTHPIYQKPELLAHAPNQL